MHPSIIERCILALDGSGEQIPHAMRRLELLAYDLAIQRPYSHAYTDVLTHQEHEEAFMQATLTGHLMATAAGRTGGPVEVTAPIRTLRSIPMRGESVSLWRVMQVLAVVRLLRTTQSCRST